MPSSVQPASSIEQAQGFSRKTVAVRMQPGEEAALDYYLFPALDPAGSRLRLAARNEAGLDAYRFDTLDALVELVRRVPVGEVA